MTLIALIATIIIWGLIFYTLWWAVGAAGLPEPFAKIATVLIIIAALYVGFSILMGTIAPFPILNSLK